MWLMQQNDNKRYNLIKSHRTTLKFSENYDNEKVICEMSWVKLEISKCRNNYDNGKLYTAYIDIFSSKKSNYVDWKEND